MNRIRKSAAVVALLGALSAACAVAETAPLHDPGVWQKHQLNFYFMGFTSVYSCDGLADKLKRLLILSGARPDSTSQPGACAMGFGHPDKLAQAELTFYTLAPAAGATADGQPVEGTWRPVSFAARSPRELGLGDCELVEQFTEKVLPLFATRKLDNHTTCVPHQESGSVINLSFESFAAAPGAPAQARTVR
ncbi:MAG: hypothetical protein WB440_17035 [Steroidobacteraceae bacterium]|jgi:hypothetical protein